MRLTRTHLGTLGIYAAIAAVTALHYSTGEHAHHLHDIYRRLYYIPIILAGFSSGLRGGLLAAAVVCIVYAPHATGHISHDPATTTQKGLEMLLYLGIGALTGSLVSRLKGAQRQVESSAADLARSLEQLRATVAQLRATEDELVRTARLAAVGRLSAGLAHEIRNPLASIQGSVEILADDFPEGHPKHRLLSVLLDESHRLNEVLSRFLAFARPPELRKSPFPILPEIRSVIDLLRSRKEPPMPAIELIDPGMLESGRESKEPDTASAGTSRDMTSISPGDRDATGEESPKVLADREQIRQVLLNLLLNAAQAAGMDGRVQIECSTREDRVFLRITDSGPGFTPEALENLFTPFFTNKEKGTGLGLAISHRIVESHSGRIEVDNLPGGGAVVTVELPAAERADG